MTTLEFLLPRCRQRVLGLLLLHPQNRYHVREIARLTNTAAGSLHRELSKLAKSKVLLREINGNQVYYQANINFPIFSELASILRKTSGVADVLANALAQLTEKIEVAFIFGSIARGTENLGSDVDILIIGDISFAEAATALHSAQNIIAREINPKVYRRKEWQELLNNKNTFILEVLNKPKIFIIGTPYDVEKSRRNKP